MLLLYNFLVESQEEFEIAYQAAKAAGVPVSAITENDSDPAKVTVCRWVMDNSHCGWLIGKGGSGIQNIEVRWNRELTRFVVFNFIYTASK